MKKPIDENSGEYLTEQEANLILLYRSLNKRHRQELMKLLKESATKAQTMS